MMWCRCRKGVLYPDGAVRCSRTEKLATEECREIEPGSPVLFVKEKMAKPKIVKRAAEDAED